MTGLNAKDGITGVVANVPTSPVRQLPLQWPADPDGSRAPFLPMFRANLLHASSPKKQGGNTLLRDLSTLPGR
jgi:hypothetical protein